VEVLTRIVDSSIDSIEKAKGVAEKLNPEQQRVLKNWAEN
jgi:hypothetical protein